MPDSTDKIRPRVLIVDDNLSMAETLADGLAESGFQTVALSSSREAAETLAKEPFDALVTDLRMPEVDGLELLKISRAAAPARPVIVMTAYSAVESAIESIRQGAFHYLTKPFKLDELELFLQRALEDSKLRREAASLRNTLRAQLGLANVVGNSQGMRNVCELVVRIAHATSPVLITGETGTGKGVIARALHAQSPRASGPFVSINCAALPENLLESELFGHVKGAFTGASSKRAGLFSDADLGTLFLDEIAEISPALQAKLLRVLESGAVRPVGADKEHFVDVRILAATHRELHESVARGVFREDLLYRLDVVRIEIPPLRDRREDIPALLGRFLEQARKKHPESVVVGFSKGATEQLLDHRWPGNVRELEHLVERMVLLGRAAEIEADELPRATSRRASASLTFHGDIVTIRDMQSRYAAWVLEILGGRRMLTAEKLDVDIKTLARLLRTEPEEDANET